MGYPIPFYSVFGINLTLYALIGPMGVGQYALLMAREITLRMIAFCFHRFFFYILRKVR